MPISIEWLVPDLVAYCRFEGDITKDLAQYNAEVIQLLDASPETLVHCISDLSRVTRYANLKDSMSLTSMRHPKIGWVITIGAITNPIMHMLATMALSVVRIRYREAQTFEAALTMLQERVPSLPDLKAHLSHPMHK